MEGGGRTDRDGSSWPRPGGGLQAVEPNVFKFKGSLDPSFSPRTGCAAVWPEPDSVLRPCRPSAWPRVHLRFANAPPVHLRLRIVPVRAQVPVRRWAPARSAPWGPAGGRRGGPARGQSRQQRPALPRGPRCPHPETGFVYCLPGRRRTAGNNGSALVPGSSLRACGWRCRRGAPEPVQTGAAWPGHRKTGTARTQAPSAVQSRGPVTGQGRRRKQQEPGREAKDRPGTAARQRASSSPCSGLRGFSPCALSHSCAGLRPSERWLCRGVCRWLAVAVQGWVPLALSLL